MQKSIDRQVNNSTDITQDHNHSRSWRGLIRRYLQLWEMRLEKSMYRRSLFIPIFFALCFGVAYNSVLAGRYPIRGAIALSAIGGVIGSGFSGYIGKLDGFGAAHIGFILSTLAILSTQLIRLSLGNFDIALWMLSPIVVFTSVAWSVMLSEIGQLLRSE